MEYMIRSFEKALIDLSQIEAQKLIIEAGNKFSPHEIVSKVVVPALERIGNSWQDGTLALSQIYMSGKICEQIIDELLPSSSGLRKNQPKMAIAVLNDYHLLGKRIVYSQVRSSGYEIIDYGRKTVDELVAAITNDSVKVILISTLMYPSALSIKKVKEILSLVAPDVKIIAGGAPFNMDDQLWKQVGVDAMGRDGAEAILWINKFMEGLK